MEDEDRSTRKCCFCIPRNIGIKFVLLWIGMASIVIPLEMIKYKTSDANAMVPIECIIIGFVSTCIYVFFCKDSAGGRYFLFMYWCIGVMFAWNVYWWFLIYKGFNSNAGEWECALLHQKGTNAFNACVPEEQSRLFWESIPMFLFDSYLTWEMYRWMKDGETDESQFERQKDEN